MAIRTVFAGVAVSDLNKARRCSRESSCYRRRSPSGPSRVWKSRKTLTYGGVEAGQYPLDIYARWLSICQRTCATLTLHRFSRANFDPIHVSTSS